MSVFKANPAGFCKINIPRRNKMTVNFNVISAEISEEDLNSAIDNVKAVEAKLPFAISLEPDEKVSMPRMGARTMEFVEKSLEYASKNPELVPQFIELPELKKDIELSKKLRSLMNHLLPLADRLSDTYAVVASEAYSAARIFYHHVKNASRANVPGSSAVAKELGKRFKTRKSTDTSATDENTEE
jgi:hypothetical protein